MQPTVLFEDNHLLVINKPAGMLSQSDATGDESAPEWAKKYIAKRYDKPGEVFLGLVHRLDRPVGGVMVLARTSKAASRLSAAFRGRTTRKVYQALVENPPNPPASTLSQWLLPASDDSPARVVAEEQEGAQRAVLHYRSLGKHALGFALEIELETGRKHQIRAQLAAIGAAILGDRRYGARRAYQPGSIALHAVSLTFPHPIGGAPNTFTVPPPWA